MRGVLGAIFLACSWCWCIGMFFPVLMVRDFGVAGWVVFLIPNAIGAMLVGWYHRRPGSVDEFLACHMPAARAFSVVTILFHAAFLGWVSSAVIAHSSLFPVLVVGAAVIAVLLLAPLLLAGRLGFERALLASVAVYCFSMVCAFLTLPVEEATPSYTHAARFGPLDLAAIAPLIAIGFLTCPHLDLTFLRLRCEVQGRVGTRAFVLGFSLLFPLLMVFTLSYAESARSGDWPLLVAAHVGVQSLFTMALHLRELALPWRVGGPKTGATTTQVGKHRLGTDRDWKAAMLTRVVATAFFVGFGTGLYDFAQRAAEVAREAAATYPGSTFEPLYKFFITFYGVIFPAYLIAALFARGRPRLWVVALACALALPFATAGYLFEQWQWLWGVVPIIVVVAWLGTRTTSCDAH